MFENNKLNCSNYNIFFCLYIEYNLKYYNLIMYNTFFFKKYICIYL